jgi:ABC-type histidine transport system ATPase subunit
MNVVEVVEVNKTFDRKHVLKRLSLTGQQGDVSGLTRGGGDRCQALQRLGLWRS